MPQIPCIKELLDYIDQKIAMSRVVHLANMHNRKINLAKWEQDERQTAEKLNQCLLK